MKAYEGQPIVELYTAALAGQPGITQREIEDYVCLHTYMAEAVYVKGAVRFVMATEVFGATSPSELGIICQYVDVIRDGEIEFGKEDQWFIPDAGSTILFDTFAEALKYLEARMPTVVDARYKGGILGALQ